MSLFVFHEPPQWMFEHTVPARNALQTCGRVHPYTCREESCRDDYGQRTILVAVDGGWVCPVCDYWQYDELIGDSTAD